MTFRIGNESNSEIFETSLREQKKKMKEQGLDWTWEREKIENLRCGDSTGIDAIKILNWFTEVCI